MPGPLANLQARRRTVWIRLGCLASIFLLGLGLSACVRPASLSPAATAVSSQPTATSPLPAPGHTPDRSATATELVTQPSSASTPILPSPASSDQEALPTPPEQAVSVLPLDGPLASARAEISGMAWYQDNLILLPQYPELFGQGELGAVFALPKSDILAWLDGRANTPLTPRLIPVSTGGLPTSIPGYEGFEAIAFAGQRVYLTVEATPGETLGYVVTGEMAADLSLMRLYPAPQVPIPAQTRISNHGEEALVIFGTRLVSMYELNGPPVNAKPVAHLLSLDLELQDELSVPSLPYRVTDATSVDDNGRFWVINYYYPGDDFLSVDPDPLFQQFGRGLTHQQFPQVERLVELQFSETGIVLAERAPIQLQLASDGEARNWEALARLDERGFLLATDRYPETILAFLPSPEGP